MINNKRLVVVLPAYNAAATLEKTYRDIPFEVVDEVILVDDKSQDDTVAAAKRLGIKTIILHEENRGYGANQKTCYLEALKRNADVVVMVHPDYQYPPKLILPMAAMVACDEFDVVLGSRILGGHALAGGMPRYKYISNRLLTLIENFLLNQKLSEFHTGYRAFNRRVLEELPLLSNSDDFVFDNQILVQAHYFGFKIGEISSPTNYAEEASSISFARSVTYGFGVLSASVKYRLQKMGLAKFSIFDNTKGRLSLPVNKVNEIINI